MAVGAAGPAPAHRPLSGAAARRGDGGAAPLGRAATGAGASAGTAPLTVVTVEPAAEPLPGTNRHPLHPPPLLLLLLPAAVGGRRTGAEG